MLNLVYHPTRFQRLVQKIAALTPISWFLSHTLHHIDRALDRWSNGRLHLTQFATGLPIVMLTTIGAKTGFKRTVPLVAIPDGNSVVLIATSFGNHHCPAWYHNLIAYPRATLADHRHSHEYVAREVIESEHELYWQRAVEVYAGYAAYKRRAKRLIPIMLLTPDNP